MAAARLAAAVIGVVCAMAPLGAFAQSGGKGQTSPVAPSDTSWLDKSFEILERAEKEPPPQWLGREPDARTMGEARRLLGNNVQGPPQVVDPKKLPEWARPDFAQKYFDQAKDDRSSVSAPRKDRGIPFSEQFKDKTVERTYVLVSLSMPENELRDTLEHAAALGAYVAFRGVAKGETIDAFSNRIGLMIRRMTPPPQAMLDPVVFRDSGVSVVPAIVVSQNEKYATVRGTIAVEWLREQFRGGRTGDLGKYGNTYEIAEPDLIEVMKTKLAAIDWEAQKRVAVKNFVDRIKMFDLPSAGQTSQRTFDPTVVVTQDIRAPNGQLIAARGTRINPQKAMPLVKRIIAFDATNEKQLAYVKQEVRKSNGKVPFLLMTSRFTRDEGLEGFDAIQQKVGHPVFMLMPDVISRFGIRNLPTVITGKGDGLLITEVGLP